ncbi:MAG: hypothetical protein ACRDS9_00005 [Pseudonocardiaceae bacterium]
MSEETEGGRGDERPPWLDVAVMVLSPLSLITALLIYFAAVRQASFALALGLNVDMLEEASILSYLLGSTLTVFFPLLVASIGLLLWLWVDRMLRRWRRNRVHLRTVSRISWALPASAAVLVLATVLLASVSPVAKPYVLVFWPFVVALAVLVGVYGASLRRLAGRNADNEDSVGRRWAINASIGLLVSLLLFVGMDNFARVVGRGGAAGIIEQPQRNTRPVLLYSAQDLQLDPVAAVRQELPSGEHAAYRYRCQGLRLAFVDGDRYFLIGRNWRPRGGTVIILPRDGIRMEFPRRTR